MHYLFSYMIVHGFFSLLRYLPRKVGMKRIALHKSISARGDKMYLLVCECSDLLTEISSAAVLIPTIRARLCGYTGIIFENISRDP